MVSIMQYSGVSGYGCTVTNDIDFFFYYLELVICSLALMLCDKCLFGQNINASLSRLVIFDMCSSPKTIFILLFHICK